MELCLPPQQLGCPRGVPGHGCWVQRWEGLVLTRAPVFGDSLMGLCFSLWKASDLGLTSPVQIDPVSFL